MSYEPCMCGAYDCRFCGPLMGFSKCLRHGDYACEPCEEYAEEHGEYPEPDDEELDVDELWDDDE